MFDADAFEDIDAVEVIGAGTNMTTSDSTNISMMMDPSTVHHALTHLLRVASILLLLLHKHKGTKLLRFIVAHQFWFIFCWCWVTLFFWWHWRFNHEVDA